MLSIPNSAPTPRPKAEENSLPEGRGDSDALGTARMFFPPEVESRRIYGRDGHGPAIETTVLFDQATVDEIQKQGGWAAVFGF